MVSRQPRRGVGGSGSKETDLLIPAARSKANLVGKGSEKSSVAPRWVCQKPGLWKAHDGQSQAESSCVLGGWGLGEHGVPGESGERGEDYLEPTSKATVHRPPDPAEPSFAVLWTGRAQGWRRGPTQRRRRTPCLLAPGLQGPRAMFGHMPSGLVGPESDSGWAPAPRRPAQFTLACSRAGAQAKQVQVPLRCAEGTYSWCSRLLAVSQTRRWPSADAKAKYAWLCGEKAQGTPAGDRGSATPPPPAAIAALAPRQPRVRPYAGALVRGGAWREEVGRRERREPREWLFARQQDVGQAHPVDGGLLDPVLTCTGKRDVWSNSIVHYRAGPIPLKTKRKERKRFGFSNMIEQMFKRNTHFITAWL